MNGFFSEKNSIYQAIQKVLLFENLTECKPG